MKKPTPRKLCITCLQHRALFRTRYGRVRWDADHRLCFRCFESFRDRLRVIVVRPAVAA